MEQAGGRSWFDSLTLSQMLPQYARIEETMPEESNKKTPREVLRMVFRRRYLFLLGSAVFMIGSLAGAHYVPLKYTGTARFERRSDVAADQGASGNAESFETVKLTLEHELVGRNAVEQVVEELGLTRGLPRNAAGELSLVGVAAKQQLVRELQRALKMKWEVRSKNVDLVAVSFTDKDLVLAQGFPNAIVKNYINRVSEQIVQRLTASRDFLVKQVVGCERRLGELDNTRLEFETEHAGAMPDHPGALQERIQQIVSDIDTLRLQQHTAKQTLARLGSLRQATTSPSSQPVQVVRGPNPELQRLQEQLRDFKDKLDAALTVSHMTEKHPTVKTLRAKIAQLEQRVKETPAEAVLQTVYGTGIRSSNDLAAQLAAAESSYEIATREMGRLEKRLDSYQTLMADFGPIRQKYMVMVKRIAKEQAEADGWQGRLTGIQMALAAEVAKRRTHLRAVEIAQKQFEPSFPKPSMVLAFAIFGGLAFGGGLVLLSNVQDRSITATEDVARHFDVPVHGVIGEIVPRRQKIAGRMRKWTVGSIVTVVVLAGLAASALSIMLRLRYPEQYEQWKASPVSYIYHKISRPSAELSSLM